MLRGWMPPSLFVIVKVLSTAAAIGWTIPRGPMEIAEHIERRHPSCLTHSRILAAWNLRQYFLIFYTIQTSICCIDCLVIANICTYISLYIRNTAILVNKKLVCISPYQLVNTCDIHLALYHVVLSKKFTRLNNSLAPTRPYGRFTLNIHSFKLRKRS